MINSAGVFPDPDKVQMISHAESPKEKASVKSCLAVVNYYRSFIPQLSDLAAPMHDDITPKGVKFYWNNDNVEARFVEIKEMIAADVLLTHFDGEKVVHVNTDASAMAICGHGVLL